VTAAPRILVAERIAPGGMELLAQAGEVVDGTTLDRGGLLEAIGSADALVVRSATDVDAELIARAEKLRVIGRAGVGVDNVDVAAATRRGILVCNAPQSNIVSAAEHTIALLLAVARNVPQAHAALEAGRWERSRFAGVEVDGKTLGVLGFGRIGQLVAARARGLGMRILAYDPHVTRERFRELGVASAASLDEVYTSSDFITLHLPLTVETQHLISHAALGRMRPGTRLINAARGSLVDTEALVQALRNGTIEGAALDVFEQEPLPADSPLLGLANVVLTPHLAASTTEAQDRAGVQVAEQVVSALAGGSVANALNIPQIGEEEMAVVGPFIPLAEKLGRLAMGLARDSVERIEVATAGGLAGHDTRLLTLAALRGAFAGLEEGVNLVNVRGVAENRGIDVTEQRREGPSDYQNMLAVTARHGSEESTVVGTTMGREGRAWLVRVLNFEVDLELDPLLLVLQNDDAPGMVGRIGLLLGEHGVNISNMRLSRSGPGGDAMMVLSLDGEPSREALDALEVVPGVRSRPWLIRLP
jgi:D-3-phosphoglycerate dehydrogenase / 2-oxoglutarate reductase